MNEKVRSDEIDYFSYFKKLYETWEESTYKMVDMWLNSPLMERALDKSSELHKYIHDFMNQSLENSYPAKNDTEKLFSSLSSLEKKVARLEEKVETLQSQKKIKSPSEKRASNKQSKAKENKQ